MSSLGSSVINKSNRKAAPKAAPSRRRPTSISQAPLPTPPFSQTWLEEAALVLQSQPGRAQTEAVDLQRTSSPHPRSSIDVNENSEPASKRRRINTRQSAQASQTYGLDTSPSSLLDILRSHGTQELAVPPTPSRTSRSRAKGLAEQSDSVDSNARAKTRQKNESQLNSKVLDSPSSQKQKKRPQRESAGSVEQERDTVAGAREEQQNRAINPLRQPDRRRKAEASKEQPATDPPALPPKPLRARARKQNETAAGIQEATSINDASARAKRLRNRTRDAKSRNDQPSVSEGILAAPEEPAQMSGEESAEASVEAEEEEAESAEAEEEEETQESGPPKKKQRRRATPEGAEQHKIDTKTTLMFDLTKDSRKGQKSKLEAEFQEIDWAEVVRLRKEAEARAREGILSHTNGESHGIQQANQAPQGPRLKLVNGQIVLDNSSLVVDRHAAAVPDENQPAIEERDITRRVTSHTWMHDNRRDPEERYFSANKADPWSAEATDKFYSALRMWGTDFFMISKMFPGRTRRHIKMKFVREERASPLRIKDALVGGSVPMDLEAYCAATGKSVDDYKDPVVLQEELRREEEQQKQEIERQREEQALALRKKQEAAAAKAAASKARKSGEKAVGSASRKRKQTQQQQQQQQHEDLVNNEDAANIVETIEP